MTKLAAIAVLLLASVAMADGTTTVCVGTTATRMPPTIQATRTDLLIENLNENPLFCSLSRNLTTSTAHVVPGNGWRSFPGGVWYCISDAQQTERCTVVSEVTYGR